MNTPRIRHQHVTGELYHQLRLWIAASPGRGYCGIPQDVRINDRNVYAPDVWCCCEDRIPDLDEVRLPWLPDLAVEVLSPSTRRYDLGVKRERYEETGVPELWIIDPRQGALVPGHVLRRSEPKAPTFDLDLRLSLDDELTSPQLSGFALGLRDLLS